MSETPKIKKSKKPQKPAEEKVDTANGKGMLFTCGHCNTELAGYNSLYAHTRKQHPDKDGVVAIGKMRAPEKKYTCDYCSYITLSKAGIAIHTHNVHNVDISAKAQKKLLAQEKRAAKAAARAAAGEPEPDEPKKSAPRKRKTPEASDSYVDMLMSAPKKKPMPVPAPALAAAADGDEAAAAFNEHFAEKAAHFGELLAQCSGHPPQKIREWQEQLAEHEVYTLQQLRLLGKEDVLKLPLSKLMINCLVKLLEAKKKTKKQESAPVDE